MWVECRRSAGVFEGRAARATEALAHRVCSLNGLAALLGHLSGLGRVFATVLLSMTRMRQEPLLTRQDAHVGASYGRVSLSGPSASEQPPFSFPAGGWF